MREGWVEVHTDRQTYVCWAQPGGFDPAGTPTIRGAESPADAARHHAAWLFDGQAMQETFLHGGYADISVVPMLGGVVQTFRLSVSMEQGATDGEPQT